MLTKRKLLSVGVLCVGLAVPHLVAARIDTTKEASKKGQGGPDRVLVQDGSTVMNVGELQMHLNNQGFFGSWPGSGFPYSEAPSAQWPAGSGIEYLYVAGLWVGAIKNGVPAVTTAAYQREFRPDASDLRDTMYRTAEGASKGSRLPSPTADDDRDGKIDEDWLNGYDDDNDGKIDEDFAAVGKQMLACQYYDNTPQSTQIYPQHNPLNIKVRQEAYQWEEDRFDDFVGANFWITNIGNDVIESIYIGFFADGDAGSRDVDNYWEDDATGFVSRAKCTDLGPVFMDIAYTFDADADEGRTLGYFGIMFLGHTTDPKGETAPRKVGITTYANFSGSASFEEGGDPTNDFERYELLSSENVERNTQVPRDYRMLTAAGPFSELLPGSTLVFQTAFVMGERFNGMIENAASAQLTFNGAWFNIDGNPTTGIGGRETPVPGPATVVIDSCQADLANPINWGSREPIWINNDCVKENIARDLCGYTPSDSVKFITGILGQEQQINWIVGTAPPPPFMRIDINSTDGVTMYWDNFSETVPDVKTRIPDFEGYRVWRADNWNRPLGTSQENGPAHELWKLLFEADVINNFGADTGLDQYRYEPMQYTLPATRRRDMINTIKSYLLAHPGTQNIPCPQGVTTEQCDTLDAMARAELGLDGGRRYYRYVDRSMHRGRPYFYAVTASDHGVVKDPVTGIVSFVEGKVGDPSGNFLFIEPGSPSQADYAYNSDEVYVVPNPASTASMQGWTLQPNNDDPTGIKVEFRNLPADRGTIRIYTISGDLVQELPFDGRTGAGSIEWPLVSRNGQDVTSGVYMFSVETDTNAAFKRKIGKFVVIR